MCFRKSKIRQGRTNRRQIKALITHLEQHPYMATGKFNTLNGKENFEEGWNSLAHLNSLSTDGKIKDTRSWRTVCIQSHWHKTRFQV